MDPIINRDNELGPRVMGLMRVRTIPLLFGLGLVKNSDEVTLTIKDQQGKLKKINMKADCPVSARKLWMVCLGTGSAMMHLKKQALR